MMTYTIGIKRKWLPGYTKYRVTQHRTQFNVGGKELPHPRLVLTLVNGDELAISAIDTRDFIVYVDFQREQARVRRENEIETEKQLWEEFKQIKAGQSAAPEAPVVPIAKPA